MSAATQLDIAIELEISTGTVSRALQDPPHPRLADSTVAAVRATAARLGYQRRTPKPARCPECGAMRR